MIDVRMFDPRMDFRKDLKSRVEKDFQLLNRPLGKKVYQVSLEGKLYVLKIASTDIVDEIHNEELIREMAVLDKAKNIKNITHLLDIYSHVNGYLALLKEYTYGSDLNKIRRTYDKRSVIKAVRQTIDEFHKIDIANLDINKTNIIIAPNGYDARLVDFDIAMLKGEIASPNYFEHLKNEDYKNLRNTFR